jgi:hypothetical protein
VSGLLPGLACEAQGRASRASLRRLKNEWIPQGCDRYFYAFRPAYAVRAFPCSIPSDTEPNKKKDKSKENNQKLKDSGL